MQCTPYKVNICAVFSLVLPLALEQGKKNQYSLLFVYLLKTPKRLFLAVKMEKGVSQKMKNSEIDKGAGGGGGEMKMFW